MAYEFTSVTVETGLVTKQTAEYTAVDFDLALLCNTPVSKYYKLIEDTLAALS